MFSSSIKISRRKLYFIIIIILKEQKAEIKRQFTKFTINKSNLMRNVKKANSFLRTKKKRKIPIF